MKGFLCLLFSLIYLSSNAQTSTKITGKVTDGNTKAPIEYATLILTDKQTNKIINGATTDAKGLYEIANVATGTYVLIVEFIGYKRDTINSLVIDGNSKTVNLNTIAIYAGQHTLKDVTVTASAPIIENKIDKIVYNVANDVTSQGGIALDVLKKVPQVTVDADGNVDVQGNSNIRFLINGKPSSVFGSSVVDALSAIPASQIKSIELITSPGAKYDAEGTGGIINIILKDNKLQGINGTVNLSAGTRLQNGSVNLNVRHGNFGVNAFFSGNSQLNSRTLNAQDRRSSDTIAHNTTHLLQNGYSDLQRSGYRGGIGMDWELTKKDNINASVSYNHYGNDNTGITNQEQTMADANNNPLSDVNTIRNFYNRFSANSLDWSVNYKKNFSKENQELDILYSSSMGMNNNNYSQSQTTPGTTVPFSGTASANPGTNNETDISIDYTQPIKKFILETGVKTVIETINSSTNAQILDANSHLYVNDPNQSYNLTYDRKVYAFYLSGTFSLFHYLDVKAGARIEHTDTKIDFANTTIPSFNTVVPSIILSHSIDKDQTVKISYSRRIERPDYRELNPFRNLSDPYNITTGNPNLQPEIGDNFELGYSKSFKKGGNIYIGLVYRVTTQDIKPYTYFYPTYQIGDSVYNNVSVTSRQNIGFEERGGVTLNASLPIKDKLNLRANIFASDRYIKDNTNGGNTINGFDYRINLNATYQLPKDLIAEVFGNYNSKMHNVQGYMPQFYTYTIAVRKQFFNKKASLGITASNIFDKYIHQVTTLDGAYFSSYSTKDYPYRSVGISFTYKFGKLEFKKQKEDENSYLNNPPSF
ncbi:MAG: TonB-dependent receptor [Taibaiella sp.]|nr:TonB-dependent receptor [Taibaiella sp.]